MGLVANQLFESHGYAQVTMEQVAAQAGVSKRTLYKYFPAKEALLEHTLEASLSKDLAARDFSLHERAGFRAGAATLLHESAHWCEQHADILLPYIRYKFANFAPGARPTEDRGLLPLWVMLIDAAQDLGELAPHHRSEQLGVYFHYLYLGALMRWLSEPGLDLGQEFDTVIELFMDGAVANANQRAGNRPAHRHQDAQGDRRER